jgi:hypothetical protein
MNATAGVQYLRARPRLIKGIQLVLLVLTVGFCVWAVRDQWSKAGPLLANASPAYLALSLAVVGLYYLVFILGWIRMLDAWGIEISYRVGLQAEMVSMLAKYLPGGVWTPAARAVALRRYAGVTDTPTFVRGLYRSQAVWLLVGLGGAYAISRSSVRFVEWVTLPAYLFTLAVLALTLVIGKGGGTAASSRAR